MEKLYQSSKTRLGADCVSDHELLIAKFTFYKREEHFLLCTGSFSIDESEVQRVVCLKFYLCQRIFSLEVSLGELTT